MNMRIMYKWLFYFCEYNKDYYVKSRMSYIIYRGLSVKYAYDTLNFMIDNDLVIKQEKNKREYDLMLTPKGRDLYNTLSGIYGGENYGRNKKQTC